MPATLERIAKALQRSEDPYAGADMDLATRIGAVLWSVALLLLLISLPVSTPDNAVGPVGWVIAAAIAAAGVGLIVYLRWPGTQIGVNMQLTVSYLAVVAFAVMQWLAGGVEPPYQEAMLLPLLYVAALHPPRRILPFVVFVAIALAAPLLYDNFEGRAEADMLITFVIWAGLTTMDHLLMDNVRRQRIDLTRAGLIAREEARVDPLTRLGNRRAFRETVRAESERARRSRLPLSIAMVDIVNFKGVNDDWGHLEGDRCLQDVARTIRAAVRRPDMSFRWGGDEFALLLSDTDATGAAQLGERLSDSVARSCERPEGEPVQVRFGIAEISAGMQPEELVEAATLSLHAARAGSPSR